MYFREKYSFLKQGSLVTFNKFDISKKNQEIVSNSKSGLMPSRQGSWRKSWGRSSWGLKLLTSGGCEAAAHSALRLLYHGLSSQGSY